ncbi:MAG: hypothetical protein ACODAB_02710 [Gemmatimonadota bacterium]
MAGVAALAGWWVAGEAGIDGRQVACALALAWSVQAAAFVVLVRAIESGRDLMLAWGGGIAARAGALLGAWLATRLDLITREAAMVFGLGLAALIILEAIWLATTPRNAGSNDK